MRLSDENAPRAIADLLGGNVQQAPFRAADEDPERTTAYKITMHSAEHDDDLTLLLWPGLSRVDVHLGKSTWTLKGISDVQLFPDIEVLFRREEPPALLFVSVQGRVALVS